MNTNIITALNVVIRESIDKLTFNRIFIESMYTQLFKYMTILDDLSYNCLSNKIREETIYPRDIYVLTYFNNTSWDKIVSFEIDKYIHHAWLIELAKTMYISEHIPTVKQQVSDDNTISVEYDNYLNTLNCLIYVFKHLRLNYPNISIRELCAKCNDTIENYLLLNELKNYILSEHLITKKSYSQHDWLRSKHYDPIK